MIKIRHCCYDIGLNRHPFIDYFLIMEIFPGKYDWNMIEYRLQSRWNHMRHFTHSLVSFPMITSGIFVDFYHSVISVHVHCHSDEQRWWTVRWIIFYMRDWCKEWLDYNHTIGWGRQYGLIYIVPNMQPINYVNVLKDRFIDIERMLWSSIATDATLKNFGKQII